MSKHPQRLFEFGPFRLDTAEHQLLRNGEPVQLTPKAFETLVVLVERNGHLVEKDELIEQLWPDSFVEEANLTNNVWSLRKTLGDDPNGRRYIETVSKRGYRFTGQVRELADSDEVLVLERHALTRIVSEEEQTLVGNETVKLSEPRVIASLKEKSGWTRRKTVVAATLVSFLVVAAAVSYPRWNSREAKRAETGAASKPELKSIAILPFKSIGAAGGDNEYLALGLADALITRLGNVRQITVRPTSAIRRYADVNQDPAVIGRQQGVDAVFEGSFQQVGDRLRITAQLIRVSDGAILWANQFDERFTNIFSVQDSISYQVACDLVSRICGEEGLAFVKQQQVNIEAYQAYLKGRYFWNKRSAVGFTTAIEFFSRAIELEPNYAQAYVGLGDALYFMGGHDSSSRAEAMKKAKAAALKALELDETLADAHASLGLIAYNLDFPEAERRFKRAIELNPYHATSHQWYGEFLAYMGRFDEAIAEIKLAQEIDPLSLIINTDVGKVYTLARQYDRAINQYKKALEMDPNFDEAHGLLALTYSLTGRHEDAIAELRKNKDLEDNPMYLAWFGYVYGIAGRNREAQEVRTRLERLSTRTYVAPYWFTFVDVGLGEKERVFKEIGQMFEGHPDGRVSLKVNAIYDSLRSDPRYDSFLRRAGFTP